MESGKCGGLLGALLFGGGSGGGGVSIVNVVYDETLAKNTLDKNYNEIMADIDAGKVVLVKSHPIPGSNALVMLLNVIGYMGVEEAYAIYTLEVDLNTSSLKIVGYAALTPTDVLVDVSE